MKSDESRTSDTPAEEVAQPGRSVTPDEIVEELSKELGNNRVEIALLKIALRKAQAGTS